MPEHFEKASDVLTKIKKQPLGYLYQQCFYSDKHDAEKIRNLYKPFI
jgi:hypothetical protein